MEKNNEEIIGKYKQAAKLVDKGLLIKEACVQVGMNHPSFAYWRTRLKKNPQEGAVKQRRAHRAKLQTVEIPDMPMSHRVCVVIGSADEVMKIVRGL